jgi:sterol desaturase/sphingolipid hydroxylase (fatty acid hydroxylase superfamily)
MPELISPVDYAIPGFVLLIIIEMWWAKRNAPEKYEPRDTLTSLALGVGSSISGALAGGVIIFLAYWLYQHRLFDIGWAWWAWPLCFILDDFGYYWFHRCSHRVRWLWAAHVNHHSSQHYNYSTALRQSWTSFFALSFMFNIPIALLGFHPAMMAFCGALNLVYQFWIHTEVIGKMPRWFEYVMNTPSHHRVHHATNPRYLDANYAGTFIIWDRMFGTFVEEVDNETIRYGIVKQLGSFNLLWSAFHEWVGLAKDVWSAPWRHKLGYIWRPPGWSHDGSRDTSESIRARWLQRQKADHPEKAIVPAE